MSLVFFTATWRPDSFYDRVAANRREGLHTLCLLDIRVREPTEQSLARGRPVYEPPRYMSANLAAQQLLEVEAKRQENGSQHSRHMLLGTLTCAPSCAAYSPSTLCVAVARMGQDEQRIVCATLEEMAREAEGGGYKVDLGGPLHSLVIVGETHPVELEVLEGMYRWSGAESA